MIDVFVGTICTIISSCTVAYFTYWLHSRDKHNK
ncbi:type I toxin-antitoxin system Fst family toxin [Macrococcus canis]|nr:type I toxin-antitoxin system Fst family toxin [Macrococcus canis]MCO4096952.1 type I toxin-antitoxin system Fst family toxin [Macrococcus canis]